MDKSIYKYQLAEVARQTISMPKGAKILTLQAQNGIPCLWATVDTSVAVEMEDRVFELIGTGHPLPDDFSGAQYVGTAIVANGQLVWHFFEVTSDG